MPIALVASTSTAQTGSGTTPGIDTTGANAIIVGINGAAAIGYVQAHDSKNADGSWSNSTHCTLAGVTLYTALDHLLAPTVGSAHTFSGVTVWGPAGVIAAAFSGVDVYDQTSSVSETASATSHPASSGAVTPVAANCLVVSIVAFSGNPGTVTAPTGMTLLADKCGPSNNQGLYLAYEIQSGTTARTPVFTSTNSVPSAGLTKVFTPSAGAAAALDDGSGYVPQRAERITNVSMWRQRWARAASGLLVPRPLLA